MKTNKLTNNKNKLIKLRLIQTKIYKKKPVNSVKINDVIPRIKKAIFLIYRYHINNKRVLFIGTPLNLNKKFKKLFEKTNHIFIPESIWVSGILTNKESCFKNLKKNRNSIDNKVLKSLLPLKKQSDLIVILGNFSNPSVIKEAFKTETPTIILNQNPNTIVERYGYTIPGNFTFTKKKIKDNFFYSVLNTTFKKANRVKSYLKNSRLKNEKEESRIRNLLQNKKRNRYKNRNKGF